MLLPLRVLPLNDSHGGPYMIRVMMYTTSASIYVRRESDKATWVCNVRTLQEILAPMQQARPLDLLAVVTCLYHGVAYDSSSSSEYAASPVELVRREVAFTQPETWTDGGYRLTMRVAVRGALVPAAQAVIPHETFTVSTSEPSLHAIPVADVAVDDIVFGLNFATTKMDIEPPPTEIMMQERFTVTLPLLGAAFPNSFLNWAKSKERDFVRTAKDALTFRIVKETKITLELVHAKTPVAFVLSMGSLMIKPDHLTTFQPLVGSDLQHTIAQFSVRGNLRTLLQVALLPGSACVLPGSSITIRDVDRGHDQNR